MTASISKFKISDYFSAAFKSALKNRGWGAQAKIAEVLNVSRSQINDIARGRQGGPEHLRAKIAEEFGCTYEEMIAVGKKILQEKKDDDFWPLSEDKYNKENLIESALRDSVTIFPNDDPNCSITDKAKLTLKIFKKNLALKKLDIEITDKYLLQAIEKIIIADRKEGLKKSDLSIGEFIWLMYEHIKEGKNEQS